MMLADNMDMGRTGTGARLARLGLALLVATGVSGCGRSFYEVFEGTERYSGPDSVIATAEDYGEDDAGLVDGQAAIAYDPDGCQVWIIDDRLLERNMPTLNRRWYQLGDRVNLTVWHREHTTRIAHSVSRRHYAEGDDLGDFLLPILLSGIGDHLFASVVSKVHVDIWH